jgi:PTS system nitrogen regulatory IIA component
MVITELASRSAEETLQEMVVFLKEKNKISKEKELLEKLLKREELGSTAIGQGFAIPHCKIKNIKTPIVLLARSKNGVAFNSIDGKPSQVFFLVVSSPDNPSQNLQILATIAHLIRKAKTLKKKILDEDEAGSLLSVIKREEEKIHE